MVCVIAIGLIFGLAPAGARRGFSLHMFFLGAAFMLLETRSLVTFSLLFGIDVAGQFAGVLRHPVQRHAGGVPQLALPDTAVASAVRVAGGDARCWRTSCQQDWFLSIRRLPLRYALASLVAFLPVFLANLVFAGSFKGTGLTADIAFASNLIGIMVGGVLEYASLLIGYRNLLLIVIAFYLVSAAADAASASQRHSPNRTTSRVPVRRPSPCRERPSGGYRPRLSARRAAPTAAGRGRPGAQDRGRLAASVLRDPADPARSDPLVLRRGGRRS